MKALYRFLCESFYGIKYALPCRWQAQISCIKHTSTNIVLHTMETAQRLYLDLRPHSFASICFFFCTLQANNIDIGVKLWWIRVWLTHSKWEGEEEKIINMVERLGRWGKKGKWRMSLLFTAGGNSIETVPQRTFWQSTWLKSMLHFCAWMRYWLYQVGPFKGRKGDYLRCGLAITTLCITVASILS